MPTRTAAALTEGGNTPTYNAAAADDAVDMSDGRGKLIHIKNASGASVTLTVTPQQTSGTDPDLGAFTKAAVTRVVAAGADGFLYIPNIFAYRGANNLQALSWSALTSITWAVMPA